VGARSRRSNRTRERPWLAGWQALARARCVGTEPLALFRLYVRGSVEERILQLVDRRRAMDAVFRTGSGR
jgi:hypothetical protein